MQLRQSPLFHLALLPLVLADVTLPLTIGPDLTIPISGSSLPTSSVPDFTLPTVPNTEPTSVGNTTTAINPSSATGSLSGIASSTGASVTASATAAAAAKEEGGSKIALVVALGVGVAGWIGL